jgi:hypothetical protein
MLVKSLQLSWLERGPRGADDAKTIGSEPTARFFFLIRKNRKLPVPAYCIDA